MAAIGLVVAGFGRETVVMVWVQGFRKGLEKPLDLAPEFGQVVLTVKVLAEILHEIRRRAMFNALQLAWN